MKHIVAAFVLLGPNDKIVLEFWMAWEQILAGEEQVELAQQCARIGGALLSLLGR